jgi:hypothetical protein
MMLLLQTAGTHVPQMPKEAKPPECHHCTTTLMQRSAPSKGTIEGPSWTLKPILWRLAQGWGKTTPTQINKTNIAQEWAIEM